LPAVGKLDEREEACDLFVAVGDALEPRKELQVLTRRQTAVLRGPLRDPSDARRRLGQVDRAFGRRDRAREDREERRLPRTVRSYERDGLAAADLERRRDESVVGAVPAADAARGESDRSQRPPRLST
jgi:hypothetical protein